MKRFHVTYRKDYGIVMAETADEAKQLVAQGESKTPEGRAWMLGYLTAQLKDREIQLTNRQRLQLIHALRNVGGALAVELVPKLEKMRGSLVIKN